MAFKKRQIQNYLIFKWLPIYGRYGMVWRVSGLFFQDYGPNLQPHTGNNLEVAIFICLS